jgi:hypothetical protein
MNAERAQAYRRVIRTLQDMGPAKLHAGEQARIRHAADELLFSPDRDDLGTIDALRDVGDLCLSLVESDRWAEPTAQRLIESVMACGPARVPEAQAA